MLVDIHTSDSQAPAGAQVRCRFCRANALPLEHATFCALLWPAVSLQQIDTAAQAVLLVQKRQVCILRTHHGLRALDPLAAPA